ncbi:GAF domain-containing protein [Nocardioides sp.]|uniref:GAF domain-containing protein n=1 Tax=Nocardioides sp. TaxID=35761 RepID=UPI00342A7F26
MGLSLASLEHGVTFTLVATRDDVAALDGIQYLFGGPCVDAAHTGEVMTFERGDTVLDEHGWQQFARATAAHAISSTLALPISEGERVVGTVNLYAHQPHPSPASTMSWPVSSAPGRPGP